MGAEGINTRGLQIFYDEKGEEDGGTEKCLFIW